MCMSARQTANEMEKGASYGKPDMTLVCYMQACLQALKGMGCDRGMCCEQVLV